VTRVIFRQAFAKSHNLDSVMFLKLTMAKQNPYSFPLINPTICPLAFQEVVLLVLAGSPLTNLLQFLSPFAFFPPLMSEFHARQLPTLGKLVFSVA